MSGAKQGTGRDVQALVAALIREIDATALRLNEQVVQGTRDRELLRTQALKGAVRLVEEYDFLCATRPDRDVFSDELDELMGAMRKATEYAGTGAKWDEWPSSLWIMCRRA
ncbi:hypothetical protein JYT84_00400, partial [bacterium AH-315-M10]|nr:hypothetical protein [bacterium AH-315-M10]